MVSVIPENVEKIWEIWNVRGTILLSLLLQVFLVMFAPFRKRCDNIMFIFSIWSAYLLADWAANFGVGQLIPQNNNDNNNNKINTKNDAAKNDVMALWAPFLMLHFGGTDTITAFALEDNQLWRRQIPSFLFQLVASLYVLILSLPRNVLWAPTLIVFVAGIIKYTERTRALFLASTNSFREGYPCSFGHVIRLTIPNEGKNEELRVVEDAYRFMPIGAKPSENKVSTTPSNPLFITLFEATYEQAFEATKLFKKRYFMSTTTAAEALRVIELQLEFLYETFYTKAPVLHQKVGFLLRLAALCSIMIALGVFSFIHKSGSDKFDNVDVVVTYALLVGAIFIDTVSLFNLIFSEWIIAHCFLESNVVKHVLYLRRQRWCQCKEKPYSRYKALCTPLVFRKWGEFISGLNLIKLCLQECPPKNPTDLLCFKAMQFLRGLSSKVGYLLGAGEVIEMSKYKTKNPFLLELWQFILDELISMTQASANRPDLKERIRYSLERAELNELSNSMQQLLHGLRFDEMLITWHVATDLCYTYDDENDDDERQFSKLLSDYMLYLLIMQPHMMSHSQESGTAGSNFWHTCEHVIKFFKEMGLSLNARNIEEIIEKEACQLIPREMSTERPYLLLTACSLAEVLKVHDKKWRAIGLVWVQILSFAADNCTTASHVTQLANGGEFLSLVWILLLHLRMLH